MLSVIYSQSQPDANSSTRDSSNSLVHVVETTGEQTMRPTPPEILELARQRREKDETLQRLAEEHKEELARLKTRLKEQENGQRNGNG